MSLRVDIVGETALIKIARAFWFTFKLKSVVIVVQKIMSMTKIYTLSKCYRSSQKIQIRHVLREYYPNSRLEIIMTHWKLRFPVKFIHKLTSVIQGWIYPDRTESHEER